jgi:superfamily I DNA/RNA helicase
MGWYKPFDNLGQKQLEVLSGISRDLARPHWVQGFAGTGKTLVVMHLLERIAQLNPNSSLCFITFTHALKDMVSDGLHGPVARRVQLRTHKQFLQEKARYDFVFLDEVQDISVADLQSIRQLADHLYLAGDADQRIYSNGASEGQIASALAPRTWKLLEIFRLTKLLQRVAQTILPSTRLIEGLHSARNAEVSVRLIKHDSSQAEASWVWREASRRAVAGDPVVILLPTHDAIARFSRSLTDALDLPEPPRAQKTRGGVYDYAPFNEYWQEMDVNLMYFGSGHGQLAEAESHPYVLVMTYHSSKGLDFLNVFMPGLGADAYFVPARALEEDPDLARRLLFVAVTRSRENLFISYNGRGPHEFLRNLPPEIFTEVTPAESSSGADEEEFF